MMNGRWALIVIGTLAAIYNHMRGFVSITGESGPWRQHCSHGRSTDSQLSVSFVLVVFTLLVAQFCWRGEYRATLLPSAGWGAISGAAASLLAIHWSAHSLALTLFAPVLMGFISSLALGLRGKSTLGDAVLAALTALVLIECILGPFALEEAIVSGYSMPIIIPLAILGAFMGYGLRKYCFARESALPGL